MSGSAIPLSLRRRVEHRDGARCRYCGLMQVGQGTIFHIDHIIPRSRGGETQLHNLALQCPHCSLHKSNKITDKDPDSGDSTALFHPLQHNWDDHFTMSGDGNCNGLTAIGRATVAALRMNDPLPRFARRLQIGLGLISPRADESKGH